MIELKEMDANEMQALLLHSGYAHLGCARDGRPYVIPIHYAYDNRDFYIYTTEGMKTEYIEANPEVCLQVEDVGSPSQWRSVIVTGKAERLKVPEEIEHAMQLITGRNPTLTPALNKMWVDAWGRANVAAVLRVRPYVMSGRRTA